MKKLVIGIFAHVDAGKTTLSESMLYLSGEIRKLGRVDNKDAYLDTDELERARGITIFSKQAIFEIDKTQIILLDTPGHVDFSAEMERTLQVLDYAILVISGADGVQGHTQTLWRLFKTYNIPVFIFINKMDQDGTYKEKLIKEIKKYLSEGCIEFVEDKEENFYDQLAMRDEKVMEHYLESGNIEKVQITDMIKARKVFPCFFGSALKLEGVESFIKGLSQYTEKPVYSEEFGAKIFKISRDDQGNRLTHMKITGGTLKVKDTLTFKMWTEKVNQIRIYSGSKFEDASKVEAGTVCAVTGLSKSRPGEGIGIEGSSRMPLLESILSYQIILPENCDPKSMLPKLQEIEDEEPELNIVWNEESQEIQARVRGQVQIEILESVIKNRFGVDVKFDSGRIVYKETIKNQIEGVGHFEPLRHYAEVHLLLEAGERGSGLQFKVDCSEDILEKNWQKLVMSHLGEKDHKGVLTGSVITDMKITLVSGRAHKKHTDGGDFREATYRAVRQGLKEAESVLLEPYYDFQLLLPQKMVGRGMMDVEKMQGTCEVSHTDNDMTTLVGSAPIATMRNYYKELVTYTKGHGRLFCSFKGYEPCHNTEEIIVDMAYDSEKDIENPTGSIFCEAGTGFFVNWNKVKDYMHVESYIKEEKDSLTETISRNKPEVLDREWISLEEIDEIMNKTYFANQGKKSVWKKRKSAHESYYESVSYTSKAKNTGEEYLLVDGYNIIHAWVELASIAKENMESARMKLLDYLSNYQAIKKIKIIVVFDAYRVVGNRVEMIDYNNIHVIYTKEAQTADQYIEKFVSDHNQKYNLTVATSDGLEQIIIRGKGGSLLSARDLKEEIEKTKELMMKAYEQKQIVDNRKLKNELSIEAKEQMEAWLKDES